MVLSGGSDAEKSDAMIGEVECRGEAKVSLSLGTLFLYDVFFPFIYIIIIIFIFIFILIQ